MKKVICFVLVLAMIFSLSGCGTTSVKLNKPVLKPDGETYVSDVEKLLPDPAKYFKSVTSDYITTDLEDDNSSYQVAVINPKREEYDAYLKACVGKIFTVELDTSVLDGFSDYDSRVYVDENHWYELGGVWMEEYGNVYAMFVVAVYETTNDPIVPLSQDSGAKTIEETSEPIPEPTPEVEINWDAVHAASLYFAVEEAFFEGDIDKYSKYLSTIKDANEDSEEPFLKMVYGGLLLLIFASELYEHAETDLTEDEIEEYRSIMLMSAFALLSDEGLEELLDNCGAFSENDQELLWNIWNGHVTEATFKDIF